VSQAASVSLEPSCVTGAASAGPISSATGFASARHAQDTPAPLGGWPATLRDVFIVGRATVLCHLLGAATSLVLRALVDPAMMGIWQGSKLLLSYGNYTNLGVSKGAIRELTIAAGRGAREEARRGLHVAYTFSTLSSLVYAVALLGAAAWVEFFGRGAWSRQWAIGLMMIAGLTLVQRFVTFHVTVMRGEAEFGLASRLSILEAVLTLVACGLATWFLGLSGIYLGTCVVLVGSWLYIRAHDRPTLAWCWDWREAWRLISIGGPMLMAGSASSLFRSLDKLMILGYLRDREYQLGCYSLALLAGAQLYGVANMLSIVMAPRYGGLLGDTGDASQVARLAARATELQAAVMAPLGGLAMLACPPVLRWLLPTYAHGLAPLVSIVPGAIMAGLALPASQCLFTIGASRRVLAALLCSMAVALAGNHVALTGGFGIRGVAVATTVAYGMYFVLLARLSSWPVLTTLERWRHFGILAAWLTPLMVAALWLANSTVL